MKKLFTLLVAALATVCASAQTTYTPSSKGTLAAGTIVDDDFATIATVTNASTGGSSSSQSIRGKSWSYYLNIRVSAAPDADNPTGTTSDSGTALEITAKKDAAVTFYFRHVANSGSITADDKKDLKVVDQSDPTTVLTTNNYIADEETSDATNGYGTKTITITEGHSYTVYNKDATVRVYAIVTSACTATLDVNGYTTVASAYDFTLEDDVTAYAASVDVSGESVTLSPVSGAIPFGEGVVLKGTAGSTISLTPSTTAASAVSDNALVGVESDTEALEESGTNYVLANNGTDTKFVLIGTAQLDDLVNKAYLNVASTTEAKTLSISFGETTGISNVAVEAGTASGAIYNLAGQQVSESYKGVVIKNGKKYVNR